MIGCYSFFNENDDIYEPFAFEEVISREVGEGRLPSPIIHVWQHPRALVIGLRDSRLPHARAALERLGGSGIQVMVRNSGGAAVPLDMGVLNVTLIERGRTGELDMRGGFESMVSLIERSLTPFGIAFRSGEIAGSYCPGDYDLSIGGRKFCGLAQRRQLHAFAVQSFINVEGDPRTRAKLVQQFYRLASGLEFSGIVGDGNAGGSRSNGSVRSSGIVSVNEGVMGSLSELQPGFLGVGTYLDELRRQIPESEQAANWRHMYREEIEEMKRLFRSRYDPRYFVSSF